MLAAGTTDCEKIEEHQTHIHTHTDTAARVCQPTRPGKGNECAVKLCKQLHSFAVPPAGPKLSLSMNCTEKGVEAYTLTCKPHLTWRVCLWLAHIRRASSVAEGARGYLQCETCTDYSISIHTR